MNPLNVVRKLISLHLLLLGIVYVVNGALLANPAYMRQGTIMPLYAYGLALMLGAIILFASRRAIAYATVSAIYVMLALSFIPAASAVVTYLWLAGLTTYVGYEDASRITIH